MSNKARVTLGLRDFFFPGQLLERTRAQHNPLLKASLERLQSSPTRPLRHGFELILALAAGFLLWNKPLENTLLHYLLFAFLLLRYQLFANDQAPHLRALSPDQLRPQLDGLSREDLFLHHFLNYCLRYRIPIGFGIVAVVRLGHSLVVGDAAWLRADFHATLMLCFSLTLFAKLSGVTQYVFEWRLLAGEERPVLRATATWLASLVLASLALVAALIPAALIMEGHPFWAVLICLTIFFAFAIFVHRAGRNTYNGALEIVGRRLRRTGQSAPGEQLTRAGVADLLLPWCWTFKLAPEDEAAVRQTRLSGGGNLWFGLLLMCCFGVLFFCSSQTYFASELLGQNESYFGRLTEQGASFIYRDQLADLLRVPVAMLAFFLAFALGIAATEKRTISLRVFFMAHGKKIGLLAALLALAEFAYIAINDLKNSQAGRIDDLTSRLNLNLISSGIGYFDDIALWCLLMAFTLYLIAVPFRRLPMPGAVIAMALVSAPLGAFRAWGVNYYQDYTLVGIGRLIEVHGLLGGQMFFFPVYFATSFAFSWIMLLLACGMLRMVLVQLQPNAGPPQS